MNDLSLLKHYKTFEEILVSAWHKAGEGKLHGVPIQTKFDKDILPNIDDIKYWEEVYKDPGNVGIFVSHDPCVELYLIVFYPLLDKKFNGVEKFYNLDDLLAAADRIGINLKPILTPS